MAVIVGTNQPDTIFGTSLFGTPPGTPHEDWISSGNGDDQIFPSYGNDTVFSGNGNDVISETGVGDRGSGPYTHNDLLDAGNGADTVDGGIGNDTIFGGRGDDLITGGFGVDEMAGGNGADIFTFGSPSGARINPFWVVDTGLGDFRDIITDFQPGADIIDLALIGRRETFGGPPPNVFDASFTFIGTAEFTAGGGATPELRYYVEGGQTVIQMDGTRSIFPSNIDGIADAEIGLIGEFDLRAEHFVL